MKLLCLAEHRHASSKGRVYQELRLINLVDAPDWPTSDSVFCLVQFYELARKEIGALILSDEHPNIVRCFAMEEDNEFVYLALERCRHSLNDLMNTEEGPAAFMDDARRPTAFCIQAWPSTCTSSTPVLFSAAGCMLCAQLLRADRSTFLE